jgi:hypothetical protein
LLFHFFLSSPALTLTKKIENTKIICTQGESRTLKTACQKFILVRQGVVEVAIKEREVVLKADHLGQTILHLWDENNQRTSYIIKVVFPKIKRVPSATLDKPLRMGLSSGIYNVESTSPYSHKRFKSMSRYYVLDTYGETALGSLNGHVRCRDGDDDGETYQELANFKLSLSGSLGDFTLGDQALEYSDYVLPRQEIQGMSYAKSLPWGNLALVYGVNRHGYWGSEHNYRDQRIYSRFLGGRLEVPFSKENGLVGFNSIQKKQEHNSEQKVAWGMYSWYRFAPSLSIGGEAAFCEKEQAWNTKISYREKLNSAQIKYKKSSEKYQSLSGYLNDSGIEGVFCRANYVWFKNFQTGLRYNTFKNYQYSDQERNQDLNAQAVFSLNALKANYNFSKRERKAYDYPYINTGHNFSLSYALSSLKSTVYVRYAPSEYDRVLDDTYDYKLTATVVGYKLNLFASYFTVEKQFNEKKYQVADKTTEKPSFMRFYYTLPSTCLFQSKYYFSFYGRYQEMYDTDDDLEKNYSYLKARLDYREAIDAKAYVEYQITDIAARKVLESDQEINEFKFGFTYFFDTPFTYTTRRNTISGIVFLDQDGDGFYAEEIDQLLDNVKVALANGSFVYTDSEGKYNFSEITKEQATVLVPPAAIPTGHLFTTASQKTVQLGYATKKQVDFGLSANSCLTGLVFIDANENGKYDASEKLVPGAQVTLVDIGTAYTDSQGIFQLLNIPKGQQTFAINIHSLPPGYQPKGAVNREIQLKAGEKRQLIIGLIKIK